MKTVFVTLLSVLLLIPSMQMDSGIVIHKDTGIKHSHLEKDIADAHHTNSNHKHSNHSDTKNNEHHCCAFVTFISIFLPADTSFFVDFLAFGNKRKSYVAYKTTNYATYLQGVFQPPKV